MASSTVIVKWNKGQYDIALPASATVAHLKAEVARQTRVLPTQQKYAGCPALCKAADSDSVFSLSGIRAGQKLMMIGTAEDEAMAFQSQDVVLAEEKVRERQQIAQRRQRRREAAANELIIACEEESPASIETAIQRAMVYKSSVQEAVEDFGELEDDPEVSHHLDELIQMCRHKQADLEAAERARQVAERARLEAERQERERVWAERELQARQQQEQAMEVDPEAKCDFTLACYSAGVVGGRPEVEVSDQIVLPAQTLERILALRIPMPLMLQASNASSSSSSSSSSSPSLPRPTDMDGTTEEEAQPWRITHCGVFDFTAPEAMAFMPSSIMKKLRLSEGGRCHFRTCKLPPGEYAQLQPLSDVWNRVPEKEACLEQALRKYQTLTVGDVITIAGPHDRNLYRFRCLQTRPGTAVSMLNTDLTLDVTEPGISAVLGEELGDEEWVRQLAWQETSSGHPHLEAVENLPLGSTVEGTVAEGCRQYHALCVGPLGTGQEGGAVGVHIVVKCLAGDPDLYMSSHNRHPSRDDCNWARNEAVGDKSLFLPLPVPEELFVAIHAYGTDTRYSLSAWAGERDKGQRLDDKDDASSPAADTMLCSNCQRRIPAMTFTLHIAQCARRNIRCSQCGAVQESGKAHEKHVYAVHSPMTCRCGVQLEPEAMALHRQFECKHRLVSCVYCPLQVSAEDRSQHLSDCGNRSVRCRLCPATFVRWQLKTHLEEAHQLDAEGLLTDYFEPA